MFSSRRSSDLDSSDLDTVFAAIRRAEERPANFNSNNTLISTLNDQYVLRQGDALLIVIGSRFGWGLFMEYVDGDRTRIKSTTINGRYKPSFSACIVDDRAALWVYNDDHNSSVNAFNNHNRSARVSQINVFTSIAKVEEFLKSFKGHELLFEIEDRLQQQFKKHFEAELLAQPARNSGCNIM